MVGWTVGRIGAAGVRADQRLLYLTEQLVRIPSPSGHERDVADFVEQRLRAVPGMAVDRLRHTVVAHRPGPAPHVLLAAHLDTVPLAHPPQPVERTYDAVRGRGAADTKSGVAVALALAGDAPEGGPATTFVLYDRGEAGVEESGMALVAADRPEVLEVDAAVVLGPTDGWIEGGCQGHLCVRATFLGRPALTARSWTGTNAVHRAAAAMADVASHDPGTVVVDGLPFRQSVTVVGVSGGGDHAVVPDRCEVDVDVRWAPSRDRDEVVAGLAELLGGPDELAVTLDAPPALPALADPTLRRLLDRPGVQVRPHLDWSEAARLAALGVPATTFGPGDPALAHAPLESVRGRSLAAVHEALAGALWEAAVRRAS